MRIRINSEKSRLSGFKYFWMKHVTGFDPDVHCARCLIGKYEKAVHRSLQCEEWISFDPGKVRAIYLCGVSPRWDTNFHLAMVPEPGCQAIKHTYNGYAVIVDGAREVEFPNVLPGGFMGKTKEFTTCRNWTFGASTLFPQDFLL